MLGSWKMQNRKFKLKNEKIKPNFFNLIFPFKL
jgi:hypothetical protein